MAYADAGNTDRLYNQEMELLETVGFAMQVAGAELLGQNIWIHNFRAAVLSEHGQSEGS
jgi:predicted nucleotidyltransferase